MNKWKDIHEYLIEDCPPEMHSCGGFFETDNEGFEICEKCGEEKYIS